MKTDRMIFLDNLKTCIIALVVIFHGAMSYMAYVPEWWYVIDRQESISAAIFVIWADAFIMPVMFFVSGYVAVLSLHKKGWENFWTEKWKRIGLPWLFGSFFIAPCITYLYIASRNIPMSFQDFYINLFWGVFYQQAHYWFLGFLMVLYAILYAAAHLYPDMICFRIERHFTVQTTVFFILLTSILMNAALFFFSDSQWVHPGYILCFQPTRAPIYIIAFFAGAAAWRCRWFDTEACCLHPLRWTVLFVFASIFYIAFRLLISPDSTMFYQFSFAFFHSAMVSISIIFLSVIFYYWGNAYGKFGRELSYLSYGVYYVHQFIVMSMVWLLRSWDGNIFFKYIVMCSISLVICLVLSKYVLSVIPAFARR